ncbi:peptidoglycan-binding protein, partial [Cognatishimia sp.]|uniref:peptidoglycan-binding domain-containing protein n=1 Tax=Cognatishimia sp. TaxID=2211648 RepID=UPI0035112B03|nr:peptidoglycan-binding protein [Cognatishimia sp.]
MNMNKCVFSWLSISIISLSVLTSPARADVGDFLKGIIILDAIVKEQNKQRPSQRTSQVSNGGFNLEERKNIQTSLNALGYNAGSVDGALGPSSRKAVQQFQTANGFEATGRLTKAQYPILLRNAGLDDKIAEKFLVPEPTPLTSQEVRLLQESLAGLGYYSGAIDGLAGGGTARGVKNFLVDIGEDPDSVSVRDALIMAREANGDTVPAYLVTEQGVSGSIAQNLEVEFNADQYITDEETMDLALARMA